jgi:hypothetical protein
MLHDRQNSQFEQLLHDDVDTMQHMLINMALVPFMALHHTRPNPAKATPCGVMHESWNRLALRAVEMAMHRRMRPGPARQAQPQRACLPIAATTPSIMQLRTNEHLSSVDMQSFASPATPHSSQSGSTRTTRSSMRSKRGR